MVKGIGFNPTDRGNETGYLCSAIQWNCLRGFAETMDLFNRYFKLERDAYYMGRISTRDAKQKLKNKKKYVERKKAKVTEINVLSIFLLHLV